MAEDRAFCPGCPRRGVFLTLGKLGCAVSGDVVCDVVGARPPRPKARPHGAHHGRQHGGPHGKPAALGLEVAVIEDRHLCDSGVSLLEELARDGGNSVSVILDNGLSDTTGNEGERDIVTLCRDLGVASVRGVDPFSTTEITEILREEAAAGGASVLVAKAPCAVRFVVDKCAYWVDSERCEGCEHCLKVECSAMSVIALDDGGKRVEIDSEECAGCGICQQLCKHDAIFASDQIR